MNLVENGKVKKEMKRAAMNISQIFQYEKESRCLIFQSYLSSLILKLQF